MKLQNIDHGDAFDWGRVSGEYAKYRDIYPERFYQTVASLGLCVKGQRVLDLGTGTGVLPRGMYRYGADFVGVDLSENQIREAVRLSRESGMEIDFRVSAAEEIDFPAGSFDVVTACQCIMYFDKAVLVPQVHRILRDGGHFCVLFMAWLPDESEIAKTSEELVLKYNPHWTGAHMKRHRLEAPEWSKALFEVSHAVAYDLNVTFTRESWHGRIKACRGIGASSLTDEQIAAFEAEHLAFLNTVEEPFDIPHYVTVLDLCKRAVG